MSLGKAVIKFENMDEEMQHFAINEAGTALNITFHEQVCPQCLNNTYKFVQDIAKYLKKSFETKYKSNWHCVVGKLQFYPLDNYQDAILEPMLLTRLADTFTFTLDRKVSSFGQPQHEYISPNNTVVVLQERQEELSVVEVSSFSFPMLATIKFH